MGTEIEVKLQATKKIMEKIYENPTMFNWKITKKGIVHLISHYYDTQDLKLLFQNYAFRLREEGTKKFLTLKSNGRCENGVYIREETQMQIKDGEDILSYNYIRKHFPQIFNVTKGEPLNEVLIIENERRVLQIDRRDSKIEICLDFLHFMRGKRCVEYNEIEIELISGRKEDLMECSSLLQTTYNLPLAGASKYELGLRSFNLIPIP